MKTLIAVVGALAALAITTSPASAADPFGEPIPLTTEKTRAGSPAVLTGSDGVRTVAWIEPKNGLSSGNVGFAQVDAAGTVITGRRFIPAEAETGPLLAWLPEGRVMAVWTERRKVRTRVIDPGGILRSGSNIETRVQGGLDVATLDDGRVLVGWTAGRDGKKARVEIAVVRESGRISSPHQVSKGKLGPGSPSVSSDTDMETGHVAWTERSGGTTVLARSVSMTGEVGEIRKPFAGMKGKEYLGDAGNRIIAATRETHKRSTIEIARFSGSGIDSDLGKRDTIRLARDRKISHSDVLPRMQATLGFPVLTWAGFKGIGRAFVGTSSGVGCASVMAGTKRANRPQVGWINPDKSALLWKNPDDTLGGGISGGCGRGGSTMTIESRDVDDYAITGEPKPLAVWTLENRDGVYMALGS